MRFQFDLSMLMRIFYQVLFKLLSTERISDNFVNPFTEVLLKV